jgi:hypothetical protein
MGTFFCDNHRERGAIAPELIEALRLPRRSTALLVPARRGHEVSHYIAVALKDRCVQALRAVCEKRDEAMLRGVSEYPLVQQSAHALADRLVACSREKKTLLNEDILLFSEICERLPRVAVLIRTRVQPHREEILSEVLRSESIDSKKRVEHYGVLKRLLYGSESIRPHEDLKIARRAHLLDTALQTKNQSLFETLLPAAKEIDFGTDPKDWYALGREFHKETILRGSAQSALNPLATSRVSTFRRRDIRAFVEGVKEFKGRERNDAFCDRFVTKALASPTTDSRVIASRMDQAQSLLWEGVTSDKRRLDACTTTVQRWLESTERGQVILANIAPLIEYRRVRRQLAKNTAAVGLIITALEDAIRVGTDTVIIANIVDSGIVPKSALRRVASNVCATLATKLKEKLEQSYDLLEVVKRVAPVIEATDFISKKAQRAGISMLLSEFLSVSDPERTLRIFKSWNIPEQELAAATLVTLKRLIPDGNFRRIELLAKEVVKFDITSQELIAEISSEIRVLAKRNDYSRIERILRDLTRVLPSL